MLKVKGKEKLFVNIGSLISAYAAVFSANKILTDGSLRLSDSVMSVILFAAFFVVVKYAIEKCREVSTLPGIFIRRHQSFLPLTSYN